MTIRTPMFLLAAFVAAIAAAAAEQSPASRPTSPQSPAHTERLLREIARYDQVLAKDPGQVDALQARGEANFRLGRINESVRDFDKVIALAPESMAHNWQRGIALYYAGRLEDGVKQFERHRTVNPDDVENAAWHFLCLARSLGKEKGPAAAREQLIPIEGDARIPLMKVHELYAGKTTVADVLETANAGKPAPQPLRTRLFYAHLYIALHHEALGEEAQAKKQMTLAATTYGVEGYMGDVARVHAWWLEKKGRDNKPDADQPKQ